MIKLLRIVLPFLSFKGLTHPYLVKKPITHDKYLTFLFFEANDSISAKSAAQILSLDLTKTFLFLNFFNYWFMHFFSYLFIYTESRSCFLFRKLKDHTC